MNYLSISGSLCCCTLTIRILSCHLITKFWSPPYHDVKFPRYAYKTNYFSFLVIVMWIYEKRHKSSKNYIKLKKLQIGTPFGDMIIKKYSLDLRNL